MNEDYGIVYVGTGLRCYYQALNSLLSVRNVMPDVPITLFTDIEPESPIEATVRHIDSTGNGFRDKITYMSQSPYKYSLFLDTDTYVCHPVDDVFKLIHHFDLAVAHASNRIHYHFNDIPESFVEFNTGVVAYRNTSLVQGFFSEWLNTFDAGVASGHPHDQPSFRRCLFFSNLRFATLTREYNCNYRSCGFLSGKANILHGQPLSGDKLPEIASILNISVRRRVFINRKLYIFTGVVPSHLKNDVLSDNVTETPNLF